jgi:hypothetical protein
MMVLHVSRRAFAHCRLECPELRDRLQLLNRLDCFEQEVAIWIALNGGAKNGVEDNRIFLQLL